MSIPGFTKANDLANKAFGQASRCNDLATKTEVMPYGKQLAIELREHEAVFKWSSSASRKFSTS